MARHGVTYDDVISAANTLKAEGKSVTIDNVRRFLGTGSAGTVNQHLRRWKEAQQITKRMASKENIPESLITFIKGLWEGILAQSAEQFTPIESNYQQEIAELKTELEKYRSNNQRWQKMFNQWQQEKLQLDNEKLTLEQTLSFAHKENASLLTKCDGLSEQLQEKQARVEELHRLHSQAQANLEHYRESTREQRLLDQQQFEREKQQMQIELKALQEQGAMQKDKINLLQQEYQVVLHKHDSLEKTHQETAYALCEAKKGLSALEKANYELSKSKQYWETQCIEQEKALQSKTISLIDLQAEFKLISQQLTDAKQSINSLQDQKRLLTDDKIQLLQEKSGLQGQLKQLQKSIIA